MLVNLLKNFSFGLIVGVFIHSLVSPVDTQFALALFFIGIAVLSAFFVRKHTIIVYIVCFFVGLSFGVARYSYSLNLYASHILDPFVDNKTSIDLYGSIQSDPIDKTSYLEFVFDTEYLIVTEQSFPVKTRILVKTDYYHDISFGNTLRIRGILNKPQPFTTKFDREFDYASFLSKDGIYYTLAYAEIEKISEGKKGLEGHLYSLKHFFLSELYRFIPEPQAGLLAGVLFGQQSALSDEYDEKFRRVGLTHIVVLSGYNVSIVILLFMRLFGFLPRVPRTLIAILSIVAFALLVGAGPTVIRASLMATFVVLAELLHRQYRIERALFLAGIAMVISNPKILYFDISFQLSFLATYGLVVLSPLIEKWVQWVPKILLMRESAVATLSAQIMVFPLIMYKIGEISLISPIVNILVLFAVPWSMGLGFFSVLVAIVSPFMGSLVAIVTTLTLDYQLFWVDIFSKIPFAMISFPAFHWSTMLCIYGIIFFWIKKAHSND